MKRINNFYYVCPKGHVTSSQTDRKKKCDHIIKEVRLIKKKKNDLETEVTKETTCNEEIIECLPIPEEFDFFNIWETKLIKAFLQEQPPFSLREGFLIDIQRMCTALRTKIDDLDREVKQLKNEINK